MSTQVRVRPLRAGIVFAGAVALALTGWACSSSSSGSTTTGGSSGSGTGGACTGTTTSSDAGACLDLSEAPSPLPKKACDPCKDIYTECPLPATLTNDNGGWTNVYYFSDPACVAGQCTYCMTKTTTEDPCTTGVCN